MNKDNILTKFTTSLNTKVRSLYDADIRVNELVKRIVELGGKGIVVTDKGTLSAIEDYRPKFVEAGLKFIPGCEVKVSNQTSTSTIILIAVNDNGYKGISKIVTESNISNVDGEPVISKERIVEILNAYKGDIIGTTSDIDGIVNTVFFANKATEKKIIELTNLQKNHYAPDSAVYESSKDVLNSCQYELEEAIKARDEAKSLAEMKFSKREKALQKMIKDKADYKDYEAELNKDKDASKKASEKLPELIEQVNDARKSLKNAQKVFNDVNKSIKCYEAYEVQINELAASLKELKDLYEMAKSEMTSYAGAFAKGMFYAEIEYHGDDKELWAYPKLVSLAKELNIPIVATNNVKMLTGSEEDILKRGVIKSLENKEEFCECTLAERQMYLKDNYELYDSLVKIIDEDTVVTAINNIDTIFDRCYVEFKAGKHYPKFDVRKNADELLDEAIAEGIKWRFPKGMDEAHKKRLKYEVSIIKSMGYSDYHLIVKDFLEYGRLLGYVPKEDLDQAPLDIEQLKIYIKEKKYTNAGFTIGPGRGSAVGSLVCYLLGITALDPLKYGLLFERFLNPERVSMPDIDSDISNTTRAKVIEYVKRKYGEKAVCAIMTTTMQAPKGAIRIAAKYYGLKKYNESMLSTGETINKSVPKDPYVSFSTLVDENGNITENATITLIDYLNKKFESNKDIVEILRWAKIIEGTFTAYGAHAAGIVISDNDDISDYIPLRYNDKLGMLTTQCDMVQVEDNGLLKFDFLGLKTLDVITDTIKLIEKNYGIVIDPLKLDIEDENVYKNILATGKTNAVFQFESSGMKAMLKRFKPTCFEDLIILVSMFRPGPLQYLDGVIDVKNGKKEMTFLCDELRPILSKTYGAIVYQEQVMEICQTLAGYTLGGADTVRRYMSKKKADKLAHEVNTFKEGCKKNGISVEIASTLFDQMMDFAKYAFNKSHAAAYAFNAYITAWLKCYYPAEFYASALNWTTPKKLPGLVHEAYKMGVKILAPDINTSHKEVTAQDGVIKIGLSLIAGVKDQADEIIKCRERYGAYNSLKDFLIKVNPKANVIDSLISSGAFDEFNSNRMALKSYVVESKVINSNINKKKSFIKSATCVLDYLIGNKNVTQDDIIRCQENAGLKVEIKELTTPDKLQKKIDTAKETLSVMMRDFDCIRFSNIEEDVTERMTAEKKYLGMYVTKHPMDFYPSSEEEGCEMIENLTENNTACYGVVTNIVIKNRKSDGAEMAFFTLEDQSGDISVCCFADQYKKYKGFISEGRVIKLYGNIIEEEVDNNENDDEVKDPVLKFIIKNVETVKEKSPSLMMKVSSYAVFHLYHEESFIKTYGDEEGNRLYIFDSSMNEVRKMNYKVNSRIKALKNVCEVNI